MQFRLCKKILKVVVSRKEFQDSELRQMSLEQFRIFCFLCSRAFRKRFDRIDPQVFMVDLESNRKRFGTSSADFVERRVLSHPCLETS